jgi:hypothetical protein
MLPTGHIAASYILAQTVGFIGHQFSLQEQMLIIVAGNIMDLDVIAMILSRKKISHHSFISHTPLGVLIIWLMFMVFLGRYFQMTVDIIIFAALFLHLVLDDIEYWFCRLGFQSISYHSQINWLYPIKIMDYPIYKHKGIRFLKNYIKSYLVKAKWNRWGEIILMIIAVGIFVFNFCNLLK